MFSPLSEKNWTRYSAAHLLNRAGFGGTPAEIDRLHALGPDKAVTSLLEADGDGDLFPTPPLMEPAIRFSYSQRLKDSKNEEERKALNKERNNTDRDEILALRVWWLNRMRYTSDPLREKATLFWHGHCATSNTKVKDAYAMWQQNETLRHHALGRFPLMLKEISRDPAMIKWLDLNQSHKDHPNENFAREVMELFSLGEGHYTEKDITEAAKAFTGYRINPNTCTFRMETRAFDPGPMTLFGKTGNFTGDDVIEMITAMPQCARYIGRKLWIFFVGENPDDEMVTGVAGLLLGTGYDIRATLGVIFRSEAFYSPKVVRRKIKSPVEWMIQTTKILEIPLPDTLVLENALSILGQVLFAPPNVKGWDGGRSWISASSLLYRYNLAAYLLSGKARILGGKGTTERVPLERIVTPGQRFSRISMQDHLVFRVFNAPASDKENAAYLDFLTSHPTPFSDQAILDFMQTMMSSPSYQLN